MPGTRQRKGIRPTYRLASRPVQGSSSKRADSHAHDGIGGLGGCIVGTTSSSALQHVREFVQGDRLAAALECYTEAISHVMYLGVGVSIATFAFAWGLGWKDIRVEKKLQAIKSETGKPGSLPDSEDSAPEKPTVT